MYLGNSPPHSITTRFRPITHQPMPSHLTPVIPSAISLKKRPPSQFADARRHHTADAFPNPGRKSLNPSFRKHPQLYDQALTLTLTPLIVASLHRLGNGHGAHRTCFPACLNQDAGIDSTNKLPSCDIGGIGACVFWHGQGCGEATRRASIATATHPVQHAVLARSTWGKTGESRWGEEVCAFGSQWHERRENNAVIT